MRRDQRHFRLLTTLAPFLFALSGSACSAIGYGMGAQHDRQQTTSYESGHALTSLETDTRVEITTDEGQVVGTFLGVLEKPFGTVAIVRSGSPPTGLVGARAAVDTVRVDDVRRLEVGGEANRYAKFGFLAGAAIDIVVVVSLMNDVDFQ